MRHRDRVLLGTKMGASGAAPEGGPGRRGEVTIVAEKKISPKAPASKTKKESGKAEAATRVSRVRRVRRVRRVKK